MSGQDLAVRTLRAIGTTAAVVVTDPAVADDAELMLRSELYAIDRACSRFRKDAEIFSIYAGEGRPVPVSDLLFDIIGTASDVALLTDGAVDPSVGRCMEDLGYDRDLGEVADTGSEMAGVPRPAPGWWTIALDPKDRTVAAPSGVRIDVGSTGKAFAADRIASQLAASTGAGIMVCLGGDIRTAGPPPPDGWAIGIATDSAAAADQVEQVVTIEDGGLASSAPGARTWRQGNHQRHHIVDPRTGRPASTHWRLVSATADTCVEANALTTAAVVWGPDAIARLIESGHPARLVGHDGAVITLNGWPEDNGPADRAQREPGR